MCRRFASLLICLSVALLALPRPTRADDPGVLHRAPLCEVETVDCALRHAVAEASVNARSGDRFDLMPFQALALSMLDPAYATGLAVLIEQADRDWRITSGSRDLESDLKRDDGVFYQARRAEWLAHSGRLDEAFLLWKALRTYDSRETPVDTVSQMASLGRCSSATALIERIDEPAVERQALLELLGTLERGRDRLCSRWLFDSILGHRWSRAEAEQVLAFTTRVGAGSLADQILAGIETNSANRGLLTIVTAIAHAVGGDPDTARARFETGMGLLETSPRWQPGYDGYLFEFAELAQGVWSLAGIDGLIRFSNVFSHYDIPWEPETFAADLAWQGRTDEVAARLERATQGRNRVSDDARGMARIIRRLRAGATTWSGLVHGEADTPLLLLWVRDLATYAPGDRAREKMILLRAMLDYAREEPDTDMRPISLGLLADQLADAGDQEGLEEVMTLLAGRDWAPAMLADAANRHCDSSVVVRLLGARHGGNPLVVMPLARALAHQGRMEEAFALGRSVGSGRFVPAVWNAVADGMTLRSQGKPLCRQDES